MNENAGQGGVTPVEPLGEYEMNRKKNLNPDAAVCSAARREGYNADYDAGWCVDEDEIPRPPYPEESPARDAWLNGFERGIFDRLYDDRN